MAENIKNNTFSDTNVYCDTEGLPWARALEVSKGLPEGSLTPVFTIWGKGSVHESITKAAAKEAGVTFDAALKKGVRWPDVPSDSDENKTNYPNALKEYVTGDIKKPGSTLYDSHYGNKQHWHSMVPVDGKQHSNKGVRDLIVEQAVNWYEQAQNTNNIFHLGKVLHMVQDSYSASHVVRDDNGGVKLFQSYNKQDAGKHAGADKLPHFLGSWQEVAGAKPALQATAKILEMYKNQVASKEIADFLRSDVYFFANGNNIHRSVQDAEAGGSDSKYLPGTQHKTKSIDHYVQQNSSSKLLTANESSHKEVVKLDSQEALNQHPELAGLFAARHLVNLHSKGNVDTLARFDEKAVEQIAKGDFLHLQYTDEIEKSLG